MADFVVIMTMIINPICALMLFKILITSSFGNTKTDVILRSALVFAISGLIGQAVHSFQIFTQGFEAIGNTDFWWVGKDISIIILTVYIFFSPSNTIKIDDPKTS